MDGTCVSSHNYPSNYGSNEQCTVQILQNVTPVVDDVDVESGYDQLFIGSVDVRSARYVPTSIAAGTEIRWTSDSSVSKKGWKICFEVESGDHFKEMLSIQFRFFIQIVQAYERQSLGFQCLSLKD